MIAILCCVQGIILMAALWALCGPILPIKIGLAIQVILLAISIPLFLCTGA